MACALLHLGKVLSLEIAREILVLNSVRRLSRCPRKAYVEVGLSTPHVNPDLEFAVCIDLNSF